MPTHDLSERLRPLVGEKSWDYIVLWKLSDDHRCLELLECICAGSQNVERSGEGIIFPPAAAAYARRCRDDLLLHPRIRSCDLLDHIPSSVTMDSGIHAETFLSNQSRWLNIAYNSDSSALEETHGTRVLVPVPPGLLELFASKRVPEDQELIDFIKIQCNIFSEEQAISNSGCADLQNALGIFQLQFPTDPGTENSDLLHDTCIDGIHASDSDLFAPSVNNGVLEMEKSQSNMTNNASRLAEWMEPSRIILDDQMNKKISLLEENNKSDDSDPNNNDENEVNKYRKRTIKEHQSKNLEAERKRRKKLNDRLYSLRALVPNISKLDRAAILGDAIDYVKDLQKQVTDLQTELQEYSINESATMMSRNNIDDSVPKSEHESYCNGGISTFKQNHEAENMNEKINKMEPQVEVFQMDGSELSVKLFCEPQTGWFVRLLEALYHLGLQVIDVNVTRHACLVSNTFRVGKKESETIQADNVKEFLLDLPRYPSVATEAK